jgi:hypothetical protein
MRAPVWICLVLGGGILCSWERFGCVPLAAIDKPSLRTLTDEALALGIPDVADPFAPPPPKPPPPPPPVSRAVDPPRSIADFVHAHANDPDPWQVTLYRLRDAGEGKRIPERREFMGQRIVGRADLPPARAAELVGWMMEGASYADGRNGCVSTESTGLRIARGGAALDLMENCGHLFLTAAAWDGEMTVLSEERSLELQGLVERFL